MGKFQEMISSGPVYRPVSVTVDEATAAGVPAQQIVEELAFAAATVSAGSDVSVQKVSVLFAQLARAVSQMRELEMAPTQDDTPDAVAEAERDHLVRRFEYIIGASCYNGNIQNYGPGGVWEGEGRSFRYPVRYRPGAGGSVKVRGRLPARLSSAELRSAHYSFGANELHIARALTQILDILTSEYGLDLGDGAARRQTS